MILSKLIFKGMKSVRVLIKNSQSLGRTLPLLFLSLTLTSTAQAEWFFDFSKRSKDMRNREMKQPIEAEKNPNFFEKLLGGNDRGNEIVIINTGKGFIPSTVRLRKDLKYKLHVVNVNSEEKNVSFILDAFSEHHSTFYGKVKSFEVSPKTEGVFSFLCPETSVEGKLVVYAPREQVAPEELLGMAAEADH